MFEKYTERAKKILFLARYEASQMGSKVIASEHLLLGLLKEGDEITREIFRRSSVNIDLLQAELEARGPSGEKLSTAVEIPFSEETKRLDVVYENCLECGTCYVICEKKALDWTYPRGGYGVCFRLT